jgi:sugar phosphate isomerase/epimerase
MAADHRMSPRAGAAGYGRALSTLGCSDLDFEGACALAKAHGLSAIELRGLGGTLDLPAYFSRRGRSPMEDPAAAAGIGIAALGTSLRLVEGTDADRADFLRYVPWAEAMGVPWLRVFDGDSRQGGANLERAAQAVEWWRALRSERGWRTDIIVETHGSFLTSDSISRFAKAAPGTSILWDSHHTWRKGGEEPARTWAAIGAHVGHIHVKDSVGRFEAGSPTRYVLPGKGEFPMAELRAALAGTYTGLVSLEWERHWHPELPPLEQALQSAASASWW